MKNILIRGVAKDTAQIIESFKEEHGIKVNTDAVIKIIKDFNELRPQFEHLHELWKYEKERADKYNDAVEHYKQCKNAVKMADDVLNQLLMNDFKRGASND